MLVLTSDYSVRLNLIMYLSQLVGSCENFFFSVGMQDINLLSVMSYYHTGLCHSIDSPWETEFALSYSADLNVYMQMRFV